MERNDCLLKLEAVVPDWVVGTVPSFNYIDLEPGCYPSLQVLTGFRNRPIFGPEACQLSVKTDF